MNTNLTFYLSSLIVIGIAARVGTEEGKEEDAYSSEVIKTSAIQSTARIVVEEDDVPLKMSKQAAKKTPTKASAKSDDEVVWIPPHSFHSYPNQSGQSPHANGPSILQISSVLKHNPTWYRSPGPLNL